MPKPPKELYSQLAKQLFAAKTIALPQNWTPPGSQFSNAFSVSELISLPNSPTNLFREATLNKYHVDTAKEIGEKFEKFIDGVCGAVCDGIGNWLTASTIAGVMINAVVGVLTPGCVIGPPLGPLILAGAPKETPAELKYSTAIANAFGNAWTTWASGLTGQLMYPLFAAVPSPVAPPAPNVPMPLITFASPGEALLSPSTLKMSMVGLYGDPTALHSDDLFDALSQAFATPFNMFKATTMVQNVLGTGPVPTFAPPFVPVGPVVGGVGTGPPGCLS
ncbi:MAG TPA: hypothetical protein VMJ70_13925 [Candidatus Sulfotelmatobacter sp.]|nr:hypothetical protein [Candidatus Sulfotelmatobacter sp.]